MTVTKNLNDGTNLPDHDLRDLMMKNLQISKEMHHMMCSMKRFIFWSRVASMIKFLIIIVPIVLSIIYLSPMLKTFNPAMLKNTFDQYQQLLNMGQQTGGTATGVDINSLPPEIQKLIPKK